MMSPSPGLVLNSVSLLYDIRNICALLLVRRKIIPRSQICERGDLGRVGALTR